MLDNMLVFILIGVLTSIPYLNAQCASGLYGPLCQYHVWQQLNSAIPTPYFRYPLTNISGGAAYDSTSNTYTSGTLNTTSISRFTNYGVLGTFNATTGSNNSVLSIVTPSLNTSSFTYATWFHPTNHSILNTTVFSTQNAVVDPNHFDITLSGNTGIVATITDATGYTNTLNLSLYTPTQNLVYRLAVTVNPIVDVNSNQYQISMYLWEYDSYGFINTSATHTPIINEQHNITLQAPLYLTSAQVSGTANSTLQAFNSGDLWDAILFTTVLNSSQVQSMYANDPFLLSADPCVSATGSTCGIGGVCTASASVATQHVGYTCACIAPYTGVNCTDCTGSRHYNTTTGTCDCMAGLMRSGLDSCRNCSISSIDYACTVLQDSAYHYWRMNDNSAGNMVDIGSRPANGTYSGPVTLHATSPVTTDADSYAVSFASGGYAVSSQTTEYASTIGETSGSLELWYRGTPTSKSANLVGYTDNASPTISTTYDRFIYITAAGNLFVGICGTPNCPEGITSSGYDFTANSYWHHIVLTWSPNGISTYVNGSCLMGICSPTPTGVNYVENSTFSVYSTGYWHVAEYYDFNWPSISANVMPLVGSITEFAVYKTTLSADRILAHYQAAQPSPAATSCPFSALPYLYNGVCSNTSHCQAAPQSTINIYTCSCALPRYDTVYGNNPQYSVNGSTCLGTCNGGQVVQDPVSHNYTCACPGNMQYNTTAGACACPAGTVRTGPTSCAVCTANSTDYACAVLHDNAYHYWRMNDNSASSMVDIGTGPANGVYSGPVTLNTTSPVTSDTDSHAVTFASGGYAVSSQTTEYASTVGLSSGSLELWYRGTPTSKAANLVGYTNNASPSIATNFDRFIYITAAGNMFIGLCGTPSCPEGITSSGYDFTANSYWHHIVFTWAPGGISAYVNGSCLMGICSPTPTGVNYVENAGASAYANGYWHIAEYYENGWPSTSANVMPLVGSITEFAVYKTTLSADRILAHYQAAQPSPVATSCPISTLPYLYNGVCSNISHCQAAPQSTINIYTCSCALPRYDTVYGNNPQYSVNGSTCLGTCNGGQVVQDPVSHNYTCACPGNMQYNATAGACACPFGTVRTGPTSCTACTANSTDYACTVLNTSPYHYWRLNDNSASSMMDIGTNPANGVYSGPVTLSTTSPVTSDTDSHAVTFASGGYAISGQTTEYSVVAENGAVELWYKGTPSSKSANLVGYTSSTSPTSSPGYDRLVYITAAGNLFTGVCGSPTCNEGITSSGYDFTANSYWHHIVFTWSSAGLSTYVNGSCLMGICSATPTGVNYIEKQTFATGYWHIAEYDDQDWPFVSASVMPLVGSVTEFSVYTTAISASTALSHFQAARASPPATSCPFSSLPYLYNGVCSATAYCRPAQQSTINTGTCSCVLPLYDPVYGIQPQSAVNGSNCRNTCTNGHLVQDSVSKNYTCACNNGWIGASCDIPSPCRYNTHGFQTYCYNGGTCSVNTTNQAVCNCTGTGYKDAQCLTSNLSFTNVAAGITNLLPVQIPSVPSTGIIPTTASGCTAQYMLQTCLQPGYLPTCTSGAYTVSAFDPCCPACIPPTSLVSPATVATCLHSSCAGSKCSNISCAVATPPLCGNACASQINVQIRISSNNTNVTQAISNKSNSYINSLLLAAVNRYCTLPVNWVECNLYAYTLNYLQVSNIMYTNPTTANITISLPSTAISSLVAANQITPTSKNTIRRSLLQTTSTSTSSPSQLLVSANSDPSYTSSTYTVSNTTTTSQPTTVSGSYYGPCSAQPCRNNGICTDIENGQHLCTCTPGWTGIDCEISETICPTNF